MVSDLKSDFHIAYLDDITLGGTVEDIVQDFQEISAAASDFGLALSRNKSEVICKDHATLGLLLTEIPGLSVTDPNHATLLGSPIGSTEGIDSFIGKRIASLRI